MNDRNLSHNLQFTRRRLKLSQKEFIENFLSDDRGRALLSVPKLSNLENRGGNNLERFCEILADRLGLDVNDYSLPPSEFSSVLEKALTGTEAAQDKGLGDIVQEADKHSQLVSFIRQLSDYLTDQLISSKLLPGDKIASERALSRQFGVSRSVARETLKVLNVLGMIDIIPGKGTFLATGSSDFFLTPLSWAIYLTDKDENDVFFVRRALEDSTIRLACKRAGSKDIEKMRGILRSSREAIESEDYELFSEYDIEFHMAIVTCSRNEVARSLLLVLRKLSLSISQKGTANVEQLEDIYKEHERLLKALEDADADMAEKMLREHFDLTQQRYNINTSRN